MIQRFAFVLACLALSSCASVSVRETRELPGGAAHLPALIFIKPFDYDPANLDVDRSGRKLSVFEYEFREKFTRHLGRALDETIAPAKAIATNAPLPSGNYWLITGKFDQVTQGSRLLRSAVGFGAGATKLETTLIVSDLSSGRPRPFFVIRTTGGANANPALVGWFRAGLTFDAIRTAREASAALSEYLYQHGRIPYENAIAPKRTAP